MTPFPERLNSPSTHAADIDPPDLPRMPERFWSVHHEFHELPLEEETSVEEILEMLGPPPFPKSGFPFIGFLATVYDHVATHVCQEDSD